MAFPLRVLVVEDSEDDCALLLRELTRGGYEVTSQRIDGPDAMNVALDRGTWDIVICDYSMPHFSGLDALRILRARGLDTPFIFLSGTIGEDAAVAALKEGAQDYVMKGNTRRLLPAIKRELEEAQTRRERGLMEQRIRNLEKFEAIGKLAGGIAHDFNNVIAVILGSSQMGEEEATENAMLRNRFKAIRKQAEFASDLTRQLLAFARRQVLQPSRLDLNTAIDRIDAVVHNMLGGKIEFKKTLEPMIDTIEADPSQLDQVILNLCVNAKDAMPKGGTLLLKTENVELDEEFCRLHSYGKPGSYVMLTVSDTGVGMDRATQEHIFEPFFTTKEMGEGTGLGLAMVYGIVKQHRGFIHVYSELGKGSTFRIYIPSCEGVSELAPVLIGAPGNGSGTILVAEDNAALRELAEEVLTARGYRVILAEDGSEAVRIFQERYREIDLALLDVVMPAMSGPEAFLQMMALRPNLPVIFTTGHAPESCGNLDLHGKGFLQKPYSPQVLADSIQSVLTRNRSESSGRRDRSA